MIRCGLWKQYTVGTTFTTEVISHGNRVSPRHDVAASIQPFALLNSCREPAPNPPSSNRLARLSDGYHVCRSGFWNSKHIDDAYLPCFLDVMERYVDSAGTTQPPGTA